MSSKAQPGRHLAIARKVVDETISALTTERDQLSQDNQPECAGHVDAMINAIKNCRFRLNYDT